MNPLELWMASRPESVRKLAADFSLGDTLDFGNGDDQWWIIGYTEDDMLVIAPMDPRTANYAEMMDARQHVCAEHFRKETTNG